MRSKMILRGLAGVIDLLLIILPSYMVLTVLEVNGVVYNLLPQLLFAVYSVVSITSFHGKTIGKYFARLSVYTEDGGALHLGIREVAKLLYFLPNIGIFFIGISFITSLIFGRTIHDWIGKSQVLLDNEKLKLEREDFYEKRLTR
ncbi:RDD family protein [Enterococcus ureasiticus]|uniref:RDD domain-containing protein n=1 Tax=Enterococcus ureasiticus TaxID=903984 RepID=A0A1E5GN58_9ENTE|nr:RDD family protein [Enterococcus ureasiticus]OEG14035.1 hypothetical protein BCR21_03320 [Enterococcus ureasiticus]